MLEQQRPVRACFSNLLNRAVDALVEDSKFGVPAAMLFWLVRHPGAKEAA